MSEPIVRFPVTCPKCGKEQIDEYPVAEIAAALLSGSRLRLYASCHHYSWSASAAEIEQVREYLGAATVEPRGAGVLISKNLGKN